MTAPFLVNKTGDSLLIQLERAQAQRDDYKLQLARERAARHRVEKSRDGWKKIDLDQLRLISKLRDEIAGLRRGDSWPHGKHCGCELCEWPGTSTAHPFGERD